MYSFKSMVLNYPILIHVACILSDFKVADAIPNVLTNNNV